MDNLVDLQAQINILLKQASELKARDFSSTVKEIQESMSLYGITIKDLQAPLRKQKKSKVDTTAEQKVKVLTKSSKLVGKPVEAKYIGPDNQTWSGRGLSPKWLVTLTANGAKREDYLIQKAPAETALS